jgi:RND superfamily putative drug exporter
MFAHLARVVSRHWKLALLGWVLTAGVVRWLAPAWANIVQDGDFAFLPPQMDSVRGQQLLEKAFPAARGKSEAVLVLARPGGPLRQADYALDNRLVAALSPTDNRTGLVTSVDSYQSPVLGPELTSRVGPSGQATLIRIRLRTELAATKNMELIAQLRRTVDATRLAPDYPGGLEIGISGAAAIAADMRLAAEESLHNTESTAIVLVVLILLLVYRAPGLVMVPLLAILASWAFSIGLIALLAQCSRQTAWFDFKVFRTTQIFIVVILYGATTDYCLFLVSRYAEELKGGLPRREAVEAAVARVGPAITASAMTTILSLGMMIFAEFGKFRYGGPTIALSLLVALAASLTLAPALLLGGGAKVFWPFGLRVRQSWEEGDSHSFLGRLWGKIGDTLVAHPRTILAASLLILAWPTYVGLSVPTSYDLLGELNRDRFSIRGTDLLRRYFPPGQIGPITILARADAPVFKTIEGKSQISRLTKDLSELTYSDSQGVRSRPIIGVRSLTNPLGGAPGVMDPFTLLGRRNLAARSSPRTIALYLARVPDFAGKVTRLDLLTRYDPFSAESVRLLEQVRQRLLSLTRDPASPWHGIEFRLVGISAGIHDLRIVNQSDFVRIAALTRFWVFVVLLVLLRRLFISLFLILTVLWGYLITIGVTKVVFMWFYGAAFVGLGWQLPVFLFVILVAVGEDYNIYLVVRVVEEQQRRGAVEGVRAALVRTGGIITSCGVIMAGTFAAMITGTLRGMHEMGFALAFGVLLDTFVIRTIIVPTFLAIWPIASSGRRNTKADPDESGTRPCAA